MKRFLKIVFFITLFLALLYGLLRLRRPPRNDLTQNLFQGVVYTRQIRSAPRPLMIHIVEVDLTAPGVSALITPGQEIGGMELPARTTTKFLSESGLQVAVNGSFFKPFHSKTPWDYYPHSGDPVNVTGLAISNGIAYSSGIDLYPALCLSEANHALISYANCPPNTSQAISGTPLLVAQGAPAPFEKDVYYTSLHPRTAVAIDAAGQKLWLIVVDGRQSGYSEGVSLVELADIMVSLGAYAGLNLDGGGSTSLAVEGPWGAKTLNAPIHTRIPMRQRPVANHLGIYASPNK